MKTLIVYYSLDGNTENAAKQVAKLCGADLLRLETVKKLPKGTAAKILTGGGQVCMRICPELLPLKCSVEGYDRIILGTPVWAGRCAPAVNSFLKENKVEDKITAVFTCSGSGNNASCIKALKKKFPNLKQTASLLDKSIAESAQNGEKIKAFVESL